MSEVFNSWRKRNLASKNPKKRRKRIDLILNPKVNMKEEVAIFREVLPVKLFNRCLHKRKGKLQSLRSLKKRRKIRSLEKKELVNLWNK